MDNVKEEVKRWWLLFEFIVYLVTAMLIPVGGVWLLSQVNSGLSKEGWAGYVITLLVVLTIIYWTIKCILAGIRKQHEFAGSRRLLRIRFGKGD